MAATHETSTSHEAELVALVVAQHFGEPVSEVASALLRRGPSTLADLAETMSDADAEDVRAGLLILIAHNAATWSETERGDIEYALHPSHVILRLHHPALVRHAEKLHGTEGKFIMQMILFNGVAGNVELVCEEDGTENRSYRAALDKMVEVGLVVPADEPLPIVEPTVYVKTKARLDDGIKIKKKAKTRKRRGSDGGDDAGGDGDVGTSDRASKRQRGDEAADTSAADDMDAVPTVAATPVVASTSFYRCNYRYLRLLVRDALLVRTASKQVGPIAGAVLSVFLESVIGGGSFDARQAGPVSKDRLWAMDPAYGDDAAYPAFDNAVEQLKKSPFLSADGIRHTEMLTAETGAGLDAVRQHLVTGVVAARHGGIAVRCLGIVRLGEFVEERVITERALRPAKHVREALYGMMQDGVLKLTEVPKGNDFSTTKTIYLWSIDREQLARRMGAEATRTILNCMVRRQEELRRRSNLVGDDGNPLPAGSAGADEEQAKNLADFRNVISTLDAAILSASETRLLMTDLFPQRGGAI